MTVTEIPGSYLDIAGQLGLRRDDTLYLASDVTRMALRARSAGERFSVDSWIDSFLHAMPDGTLVVPAFTDDLCDGDRFDPATSKPTTGAVSKRVMERPDVRRTNDPLHSVFVMGSRIDEIVALDDASTFGPNSIFGHLVRSDARMLIVDVDFQYSFTFIHHFEETLGVRYRRHVERTIAVRTPEGWTPRKVRYYAKRFGVRNHLHRYQQDLVDAGVVRALTHRGVPMWYMDLRAVADHTREYLAKGGRVHVFSWAEAAGTLLRWAVPALKR
jgi:aminoglycoside N3'-acetyltransferase